MAAKTLLVSAGWTAIRCAIWVMTLDTKSGWPWAEGRITLLAKSGPNILGSSSARDWPSPCSPDSEPP